MRRGSGLAERSVRRGYLVALGLLLLCLFVLVVGPSAWTYRNVRGQVEQELEERLLSVGATIAEGLGSMRIGATTAADSARELGALREGLRRIATNSNLSGIEIIDARRRHLVGTTEETPFGEKNPLVIAQPEVSVALAGIPAATPLYEATEVSGVFFKTGFVPIERADGRVLGAVAVEGGSGFFAILPSLRRIWWITGLASALIAALLLVLLLGVFRALERYEGGLRGAAALATAGQLAAVVAHEIRNPLAILQSRAERVQEELAGGADPGYIAGLLETIPIEVKRLDRILRNYLSLARVAEGTGRCHVGRVVAETMELAGEDLRRAGIRASFETPEQELRARIDAGPLRQTLLNLILNAREAMPGGGDLNVRARADGAWIRLEVTDTGSGIDRKTQRRIFQPFFTTRSSGSGLGLAVVDSVVRSCGGRVEVHSEPGRGSTFVLWLPKEEREETDGDPIASIPDPARGG